MLRRWRGLLCLVLVLLGCSVASAVLDIRTRRLLNDGTTIPLFGLGTAAVLASSLAARASTYHAASVVVCALGTYRAPKSKAYRAVLAAIAEGYRHIDTAARYGNEEEVGMAVRDSGVPREELYVTTKLWNDDQGYDDAIAACEASLQRLGLDYVDLYLIHSPVPGKRLDSWRALEFLQATGRTRSIGVSNYGIHHLEELRRVAQVMPAVNQIEAHPFLVRDALIVYCEENDIAIEAYSPLAKARRLDDPDLVAIGAKHGKTAAQVMLRWAIQHNFITIPKSESPRRIRENAAVFDFKLSHEDMAVLNAKHEGLATGWNPVEDPAFD